VHKKRYISGIAICICCLCLFIERKSDITYLIYKYIANIIYKHIWKQLCFSKFKYKVDEATENVKETPDDVLFTQYAEVNRHHKKSDDQSDDDQMDENGNDDEECSDISENEIHNNPYKVSV
jgi:hypothetical protein